MIADRQYLFVKFVLEISGGMKYDLMQRKLLAIPDDEFEAWVARYKLERAE